jgi:hypothetical protein
MRFVFKDTLLLLNARRRAMPWLAPIADLLILDDWGLEPLDAAARHGTAGDFLMELHHAPVTFGLI